MLFDRFEIWVRSASRWMARLAGLLVVLIALMVTGDVLARNLVGRTMFHSFEISAYLFAAALSFGMAHTLASAGNIRIDVIYALFPRGIRRALDLLALAGIAALGLFMAWFAWGLTLASQSRGVASNTALAVPQALPQAAWALGLTTFALVGVVLTVRHAMLLATGRGTDADRLGGVESPEGSEPVPPGETR